MNRPLACPDKPSAVTDAWREHAADATLDLAWDLSREHLTLGGALILRQEAELLAQSRAHRSLRLFLVGDSSARAPLARIFSVAFASSEFRFQLFHEAPPVDCWPSADTRRDPLFSYYNFDRITALSEQTGLAPRLRWHAHPQALAQRARARFPGRLICIHLRSVAPFAAEESNADGPTWDAFFAAHARPGSLDFLLIGDDPLPVDLTLRPGVSRAVDLGLDLATQLALVSCADGFLGMASGLCTAANLSDTPHVIFKHPAHHPAEMMRELGTADRFPFAGPRQRLWRRTADVDALGEALALLSP